MSAQQEKGDETKYIDVKCVAANAQTLGFIRNWMTIFMGSIAGILGLTGFNGFILYIALYLVCSISILAKLNFNPERCFPKQTSVNFVFSGITGQMVPFVMYWTLFYALVHLY